MHYGYITDNTDNIKIEIQNGSFYSMIESRTGITMTAVI